MISLSRSTISLTATLCTRPAESDGLTFFQSTGESSKPHQTVEHAARLLRVDQIHIYRARVLYGREYGVARDLVEYDSSRAVDRQAEHLGQMPRYGLSLAVLIGCQPYVLYVLREARQFVDHLALVARDLVYGFVVAVEIDAQVLLRKVAYVAEAGLDDEALTQKLLYRLGLGRRLHNYQIFLHCFCCLFYTAKPKR